MKLLHLVANPRTDLEALAPRLSQLSQLGVEPALVRFGSRLESVARPDAPRVHAVNVRLGGDSVRRRKLTDLLKTHAPGVVVVDDPEHPHGKLSREVTAALGLRTVLELRRMPSLSLMSSLQPDDVVVVPERVLRKQLVDHGVSPDRIHVVAPSFSRPERLTSAMAAPVRATPGVGLRPLVVHASAMRPGDAKYLVKLALAFRQRDPSFLLAVIASGSDLRELRAEARGTALVGHHLVTVGAHAGSAFQRRALLAAADLVMFSGDRERWLSAASAALTCLHRGRPVALRWDDGLTRKVEALGAGMAFEDDAEWAAFEAVRLLRQPYWRRTAKAAAPRVTSHEDYDEAAATQALASVYGLEAQRRRTAA